RRSHLPRLLLALPSNNGKDKDNNKNNPIDVQALTGSLHIRACEHALAFMGIILVSFRFQQSSGMEERGDCSEIHLD
ncbi:MAG: hypothetical protein WB425_12180, partial [Terracidiphilus sp.]